MITIDSILEVEKYISNVTAVIFDLDDTLYSEKEYIRSGFSKIAKAYPMINNCEARLWNAFEKKESAIDSVLKEEGLIQEKDNCIKIYRNQIPNIHLYEGVKEMLQRIGKAKKMGMITDGRPEGQNAKIDSLGIRELFDEIIITDTLGGAEYRKPNPKAFMLMSEKLKVKTSEMIYVGDNINKDFKAPNELNMEAIWYNNRDGLYVNS